jgi:thiamine-monophosphate kinase
MLGECLTAPDPATLVAKIGEHALLRHLRSRIPAGLGVVVGLGDDAAALETGALTLITTDSLVEGTHFKREWCPARLLGRKALTVNLSDIAAMAGLPRFATVSLALPPDVSLGFVDGLFDGLLERAAEAGVVLVGGNLASSNEDLMIDIVLLGQGDALLRRNGAEPGDLVVVTGTLGAAAAGVKLLGQGARLDADGELDRTGLWTQSSAESVTHCLRAALDPVPPLALARALSEHDIAHAGIDISDGLSGDLMRVCEESGVTAQIDPTTLPVDPHAAGLARAQGGDEVELALHGGEDYQLLLALPPDRLDALNDLAIVWEIPLSVVGTFGEGEPALSLRAGDDEIPLEPRSFQHFSPEKK